ncbi:hypothetical protein M436DRAFT_85215 [Aureobasidium namibiae CBS 147.97]|uniref:Uncharacterized protein n=1 Tax=Aureobasidium namibiae CBS 147.97 TaxID=1043004 RepID=A0A074X594_9PEZI
MSSAAPTIVFLTAEDLEKMLVCIKSDTLKEKLSAINNPHGATLTTASLNSTQRLLDVFEGDAKKLLSLYLKDPTQSVNFNDIKSIPLKRGQRREVHNLIRQVSKDKLDSDLDSETSRIQVFVRNTAIQNHNQEKQRQHKPQQKPQQKAQQKAQQNTQQNTQQNRPSARAAPYRNTKNNRKAASRNKLATRGVAATRTPASIHMTVEQLAQKFASKEQSTQSTTQSESTQTPAPNETTQPTAETEAAPVEAHPEHVDAPLVEFRTIELHNARVHETFKLRVPKNKEPELSAEEIAERAEARKNVVPPHMRGAASEIQEEDEIEW